MYRILYNYKPGHCDGSTHFPLLADRTYPCSQKHPGTQSAIQLRLVPKLLQVSGHAVPQSV